MNFATSENCVEVARSHDSNDGELELGTTCLSCVVCSPTSTVAPLPLPCSSRYRHTLGQLRGLLEKLHELINPMKDWEREARKVLKKEGDNGKKEGEQEEEDWWVRQERWATEWLDK